MEAPASISFIGWLHTAACYIALISGALQFIGEKGSPRHRVLGEAYFYSMVIANFLVMFIYKMDILPRPSSGLGPLIGPVFGYGHWIAAITLVLVLAARYAASRQRQTFFAYLHPIAMIVTYWFLVGGGINEAFLRIDWLHDIARAISPDARFAGQFRLLILFQLALDAIVLAAIVMTVIQVRRSRRQAADAIRAVTTDVR